MNKQQTRTHPTLGAEVVTTPQQARSCPCSHCRALEDLIDGTGSNDPKQIMTSLGVPSSLMLRTDTKKRMEERNRVS